VVLAAEEDHLPLEQRPVELGEELVVERHAGDLDLHDAFGGQALGLEAARATLSVHEGRWRFSQVLAGRALGMLDAAVGLQAAPTDRWPSADAALEGRIRAQVTDLGAWAPWIPAGWRLAGELHGEAQLGGRLGAPLYAGTLAGTRVGLRNLLQGVNLGPGELELRFEEDGARIERFVLAGGEGTLRIGGEAHLGATPSARFDLHAERFRVLGRIDRRIVASGDATVRLDAAGLRADGRVTIDEGQLDLASREAPVLDDDVTVHDGEAAAQRPGAKAAAPATAGAPRVDLELAIDLGSALRLRGRGIDTKLAGALRATTPGGRLAVDGTVHTVGGTYAAYGQQLEIARGNLEFVGSIDDPRLDVLALRPNLDVAVGVEISGDALNPRVRLYADDASLSDTDKLSWLLLGRAPDGLGRDDAALLQRAALALLAGENGPSSGALLRNLGLDELSVRQTDDGTVRQTVVSLGKQLSRHWYVGYERGINAAAGAWQLVYRIARRFTLRAQSGEDSSLDLIWTWRRGVAPPR
jgi:translocation and assembly module TamB